MQTWVKYTGIAAFGLLASTALAADHTDGSADGMGTDANPSADISDVYAWAKDDGSTIVLIMDVVGDFSDATQYAFHVGRSDSLGGAITAASSDVTDVICEFDAGGTIQCWAGDSYVTGDATPDAGITSDDGNMKVHAAEHADPFFFYLGGFNTAISTALAADGLLPNGIAGLMDDAGCPDLTADVSAVIPATGCPNNTSVAQLLAGMLNGTYVDTDCSPGSGATPPAPFNTFAANNVHSLVLEVDASLFDGTGDYLQVWASTHAKN